MNNLSANLRFTGGGSDKVYQLSVVPADNGAFNVQYGYARYGAALRFGNKNKQPLTEAEATKLFEKVLKGQLGEGYKVVDGNVTAGVGVTNEKKHSGIYPQLLTPVSQERVSGLISGPFWLQEKHDGERLLVWKKLADIVGINRNGEERPIPAELAAEIALIDGDVLLDGELVGDTYWVFDVLVSVGVDRRHEEYSRRYQHLRMTLTYPCVPARGLKNIKIVLPAVDVVEKQQLAEELEARRAEGMVFVDPDGRYEAGRGSHRLKFKFTEMATCLVGGLNGTKRSISLQLVNGGAAVVGVGNCTIPANFTMPHPGDLVEIRYLYAYPGGSLYQPVYLGPRTDKMEPDLYGTLKFKAGTEEDEG
jgi:bifunctional non-homologous end joining protein LigD